jgi:hypothetical protein
MILDVKAEYQEKPDMLLNDIFLQALDEFDHFALFGLGNLELR